MGQKNFSFSSIKTPKDGDTDQGQHTKNKDYDCVGGPKSIDQKNIDRKQEQSDKILIGKLVKQIRIDDIFNMENIGRYFFEKKFGDKEQTVRQHDLDKGNFWPNRAQEGKTVQEDVYDKRYR